MSYSLLFSNRIVGSISCPRRLLELAFFHLFPTDIHDFLSRWKVPTVLQISPGF